MKRILNYFTKAEWALWLSSLGLIIISFIFSPMKDYMSLISSLIGVTSLIFAAKGNPISQVLIIIFSIMYGIISFSFAYYGEVITYVLMTGPMAVYALVSWLKNPYKGNRSEVKVNKISVREMILMFIGAGVITLVFYFILRAFGTSNLVVSTLSVTTSFIAVYLTARRSPYFALAYAANDIVLIIL